MFEPEVCRKQMYCIEESTCGIVGTYRRPLQSSGAPPQWFGVRGIMLPLPPLVTLVRSQTTCRFLTKMHWACLFFSAMDRIFFNDRKKIKSIIRS